MELEKQHTVIGGNMNRFSIVHDLSKRTCIVCGTSKNIHIHEIFYGTANRKKSIEYGLCVCLCAKHHNMSNEGVHFNKVLDNQLKQQGQKAFMKKYPNKDFVKIFGRNYLE